MDRRSSRGQALPLAGGGKRKWRLTVLPLKGGGHERTYARAGGGQILNLRFYRNALRSNASGGCRSAVEAVRPLHESFGHPGGDKAEGDAGHRRQQHALEGEIDQEMDFGPAGERHETPARVEALKRAFDMTRFNRQGAAIQPHEADIALMQGMKGDSHLRGDLLDVTRHFAFANDDLAAPGREFRIALEVGHH